MPAKHLRAKPALEADDVILLDRASSRHRRSGRLLRGRDTPETGKSAMHLDNQPCELVGRDLVMPHIAADDVRDVIKIDPWRRILLGHCTSLLINLGRRCRIGLEVSNHPGNECFYQPEFWRVSLFALQDS